MMTAKTCFIQLSNEIRRLAQAQHSQIRRLLLDIEIYYETQLGQ